MELDLDVGVKWEENVDSGAELNEAYKVIDIDGFAWLDVGDDAPGDGASNLSHKDLVATLGLDDDGRPLVVTARLGQVSRQD